MQPVMENNFSAATQKASKISNKIAKDISQTVFKIGN